GVAPETRVALLLRRGPELVQAMVAVLKAGGAYVPLDPAAPAERLRDLLGDSAPRVVLTQSGLSAQVDLSGDWQVLELDALPPLVETTAAIAPVADPNRLAYVIYTSGSTGKPNGVMVEHRHLANLVGWHTETFPLSRGERTSSTAGVAFDACTWEVWPALCQGATLALPPSNTAGDPSALLDWWESQDLQSSFLVTALADAALARGQSGRTGLRTLLTGGDRLNRLPTPGLPFALVNNYGPTETTVVATSGVITPEDTVIHIGRPIANTRLYLLDRHGRPVPVGAPGELHIGGAQVARGYLNRPELTAARFLPDPFSDEAGARMYRTGDLGRWRADGTIEYLGRNDQQVKLRGLRIELGEIEAQLSAQRGIREAAVIAREDAPGEVRLVAYVVAPTGETPDPQRLREGLSRTLPEYMLPAAYVALERLPLTPNGKLDRRALPEPEGAAYAQRAYEAPEGPVETALAAIWRELLRVDRVGRHDNFFELGGHSLLVTRLIDVARRRGLLLDLRQVFDAPTLAGLAAVATPGGQDEDAQSSLIPVRIAGSRRPLFCFHEGFGSVLAYERLARFIDADVPVYSMEARAMHEDPPVFRSLVDMARDYLRQIRAVQPAGPYRLAGWSGGGLIAYEVARQLRENGESVGYLGMIDTYRLSPEDMEGDIAATKHFLIRILQYLRPELSPAVLRGLLAFDDLDAMVAECQRNGWLGPEVTGHEMDRRFRVANDIARASVQYVPPPIDLDVSLFSAEEPVRDDRSNGWSALLGPRLDVIEVGGTHMAMMQDETLLARIASPMNRALLDAGAASPQPASAAERSVDLSLS
ncbi:non-ribosomal peptide synthetase, partial [Lysobacter tyrosinilyticus]